MNEERRTGTQFITTNDGVKIAYERVGRSGPVVVLLHGMQNLITPNSIRILTLEAWLRICFSVV